MRLRSLPLVVVALVVSACSLASRGSQEVDSAVVKEMKSRILELQKRAAVTDVELERLRREVARLDALLQTQDAGTGETADSREMKTSVGPRSTAAVEESDLDLRSAVPPAQEGEATAGGSSESGGEAVGYQPVQPAAQALYDRGYTEFHQGRYLDAEATFQRFLQAYQDTELADNAQYWIGECRFARGDLEGALTAFRETVKRYPEGNKVPDALLKEGTCLEGLGDIGGARLRYREVLRRFPGSAAAAIAEERRAALGG